MNKRIIISMLTVILFMTTFITGCQKTLIEAETPPPTPPKDEIVQKEITLYFSDDQAEYLIPEKRVIDLEANAGDEKLITSIIEELIMGPSNEDLFLTIPENTKVISVEISDEIAIVDFSKEIKTEHWGGSTGENMTLTSLVNTVTELDKIKKVMILIEGEKQDSLAGHISIEEPLERQEEMIKK
ncbi:MAG TPA: GerMN domain-containing protein [Syntrophomonadaceae bacterium]|nr:GerMN domain-containing protein [Syntrophomonadaceae bacterium]